MSARPRRLERALVVSVAFGAAVYVGYAAFSGWHRVAERLGRFAWSAAALGLALAVTNYLFRYAKWELYLRALGVVVPWPRSLRTFLSGFALTVTPGKVGEVLKSYLLRESDGVPMARTAPIVLAERVTDLIALLALAVAGIGALGSSRGLRVTLGVGAGLVAVLILGVASERVGELALGLVERLPVIGRAAPKLREFHRSTRTLFAPGPLVVATLVSVLAWFAECAAFRVILGGFPGVAVSATLCTFIYAAMTIAGALSFLPGGVGVQEGGMVALLVAAGRGIDEPTAFAATFVTRLCTLWFAVLVGVVALLAARRAGAPVDLAAIDPAAPPPPR